MPVLITADLLFSLGIGSSGLIMQADRHTNTNMEVDLDMSRLSGGISAAILCLGMLFSASMSMAMQEQSMKPGKEAQKKEKSKDTATISGTVTAVTDSAITIVAAQKAEHTVAVTSETKVTKGGKDAALTDVQANDVVTIEAKKGADDTWLALKIAVS